MPESVRTKTFHALTNGNEGMMKDEKRGPGARPTFESWRTTDEEELGKRRSRAELEPMKVRAIDVVDGFGIYEVSHPAPDRRTAAYHVEIRSLDTRENSCDCPDFAKSGLGTCKHIERALKTAARKCGKRRRSPAGEVFMSRVPYVPRFVSGESLPAEKRRALARYCGADGRLKDCSAAGISVFLAKCERLNADGHGVIRVSMEVRRWLEAVEQRESLSRAVAGFRTSLEDDGRWPFLRRALYPYQREGALHLAGKGRAILADEMGLGKTVQGIAAALLLRETVGIRRTLVVVPASLKGEWEEQIAFFSDASSESLYGMRQTRLARYAQTESFFVIANYEQVIRDWKEINETLRPDLIILDEAQRIKNWKTKTARNLKGLVSPYAFVLTGTPIENRIDELYSLVDFVDPTLFGSLFRFNRRFYSFDGEGKNEGMCNLAELHEAVAPILLRRRKAAVEDELPGRSTRTYKTVMTGEQQRRYNEHFKTVAELYQLSQRRPLSPKEQERLQIALGLMRMLCDSCYILDPKIKDSPKLDEFESVLDDIFADDPTRKVIVFSEWTRMLDLLVERLEARNIGYALHTGLVPQKRRREEIRRFKEDPGCRLFLASESGGVGLNLQCASVVVNLDLPWNPARLEQRIARAWRKHQKREVLVVNMVAGQTIEERMLQTLGFKQGLADFVLDAMGEAADFERQNRESMQGKKKSAFMQRLASVMGSAVKVEANSPHAEDRQIPPEERLRAAVSAECPGVERLTLGFSEDGGRRTVRSAVAVGRNLDRAELSQRIVESHGVALPDEAIETIAPETWAVLQRLQALGVIRFCTASSQDVLVREVADQARLEAAKRRGAAKRALSEATRNLDMGELLVKGGFAEEGRKALCKAMALAAAAACHVKGRGAVDERIVPVEVADFMAVRDLLNLAPEQALLLQLAVQDQEFPDPVTSARRFNSVCLFTVEFNCPVPG